MAATTAVRMLVRANGERLPILVDVATGQPLFDPVVYTMNRLRSRAANTVHHHLVAIQLLLRFCTERDIDLAARVRAGPILELHEIDALISMAKTPKNVRAGRPSKKRKAPTLSPEVAATIPREQVPDIGAFEAALRAAGHTDLRLVQSGHTVDICLASTCKTAVVDALAERWGFNDRHILRVGDSGGPQGNDHALLASEMGISVGDLCGRAFQGWPMFGAPVAGPAAVSRLLKALRPQPEGWFKIDLDALEAID